MAAPDKYIIGNISNRHCHLSEPDFVTLFGPDVKLRSIRALIQPGQFACRESVKIIGPRGEFDNVRIIGPLRNYTQVEISRTDSFAMKMNPQPPVRDSGNLEGSSPITVVGPKGTISLKQGCVIAKRHVHFHTSDAGKYGIRDKQVIAVRAGTGTGKTVVFEEMLCRVGDNMALECHIDTDEGNACGLNNGDKVELII